MLQVLGTCGTAVARVGTARAPTAARRSVRPRAAGATPRLRTVGMAMGSFEWLTARSHLATRTSFSRKRSKAHAITRQSAATATAEDEEEEDPFWIITEGRDDGLDFVAEFGQTYTVGRTTDNDFVVPFGTVSGKHALVEVTPEGELYLTDTNSTNGCKVSSFDFNREVVRSVVPGERTRVESGTQIILGDDVLASFRAYALNLKKETEDDEEEYYEEEEEDFELRGPEFDFSKTEIKPNTIGEGNFGQVWLGQVAGGLFGKSEKAVVLKKAKDRVQGGREMLELEVEMNNRLAERVPGVCADYLGYCDVPMGRGGQLYNKQLSDGLWLAWNFQSRYTLERYFELSNYPKGLLGALGEDQAGGVLLATQAVMKRLLASMQKLHAQKLVHRDVKPSNILVLENDAAGLRLIDLGACADLTDGFNFTLGNCPRDPRYCPPECNLMPTDVAQGNRVPVEKLGEYWDKYAPSSFDIYSCGVVMLQLALPSLRDEKALKKFNSEMAEYWCGYDLNKWKEQAKLSAGWDLAASMLQKPTWAFKDEIGQEQSGSDAVRPTAQQALKHPFFK